MRPNRSSPPDACEPADGAGRWRSWAYHALLILTVLLVYRPCWQGTWLWDDDGHVTRPELRPVDGLRRIWTEPGATQQYYPVLHTAFWLEHRVFGDAPAGYHLFTIALHGLNAVLLTRVLARWRIRGARVAGLLFALHPVMVESVAWVSEQKNTLSTAFLLAALLAYARFDETRFRRWYVLAGVRFLLALGTKTVTATMPAVVLVVLWWRRGRLAARRDVWPLLPFLAVGAVAGVFTSYVERHLIGASGAAFSFSLVERALIAGRAGWFYGGKLLWPASLTFSYPRWAIRSDDVLGYLGIIAALLAFTACWLCRGRTRAPLTLALLFAGALFPVLGFFNIYPFQFSFVADHFQYVAAAAMCTGAGWWLATQGPRAGGGRFVLLAGLLLPLAWMSHRQSAEYRDAETLYRATLARNPASWLAEINLGRLLHQQGRYDEAIEHYDAAEKLKPDDPVIAFDRGTALAVSGRTEAARRQFERAVALRPSYANAHHNLGLVLAQQGRFAEAERHLAAAVRLEPRLVDAHRNLALVYLNTDRPAEAARELDKVLALQPNDQKARQLREQLRDGGSNR